MTEKETKTEIIKETRKEIEVIEKTPAEKKRLLIEGIKKTVAPAFISVFFAFIFKYKFGDASGIAWFSVFLLVILVSYYIQKLAYPTIGVRVKDFETKDWLYVEFLVVIYFWVFWALLLNIGTLNLTASPATITAGIPEDVIATIYSDSKIIAGATANLSGYGVNMSSITGSDGIARFYHVNATSTGNLTLTARILGYSSGRMNITSIE